MFYDFRFLRFNLNPYFSKHLKRKVNFALYFYVFILFFSVISHQISFHWNLVALQIAGFRIILREIYHKSNILPGDSTNIFTSDLANVFASGQANMLTNVTVNIFTTVQANIFTSVQPTCSPVTWPTYSPVTRPKRSPVARPTYLTGKWKIQFGQQVSEWNWQVNMLALYQEYDTWSDIFHWILLFNSIFHSHFIGNMRRGKSNIYTHLNLTQEIFGMNFCFYWAKKKKKNSSNHILRTMLPLLGRLQEEGRSKWTSCHVRLFTWVQWRWWYL